MTFLEINWLIFCLVWLVAALVVKPTKERESVASRLGTVGFLALTAALLAGRINFDGFDMRVFPDARLVRIAGDAITAIGLLTAIWARFALGGNWSGTITFKQGHELIQRGPYRWVRHPIYTGLLSMILGTAIVKGRVSGFLALAVCFVGTWRKLRCEEALLARHFSDEYPRYMARTKALVPCIL